ADSSTDRGHYVPVDFDPTRYRVLFTRARSHDPDPSGAAIVKRAYGRTPIVVVRVNTQTGAITGIEIPPPHVLGGTSRHRSSDPRERSPISHNSCEVASVLVARIDGARTPDGSASGCPRQGPGLCGATARGSRCSPGR